MSFTSWLFRRKKGGQLMTPEPAPAPALGQILGGDVHVDVGPPNSAKRAMRLERAMARIPRLKLKKQKALAYLNAGRITAQRCEEVCAEVDRSIRRYELIRDLCLVDQPTGTQ